MARLLFLPTPNTLVWLEVEQTPEELLAAIEQGRWTPPPPFEHVPISSLQVVCQGGLVTITAQETPLLHLSDRQQEVLKALLEGQTARQTGYRLSLTSRTVRYHLEVLKRKFDCQTRAELVQKGRDWLARQAARQT